MQINELRAKHPRLIYKNYTLHPIESKLRVEYEFLLEPDLLFHPQVIIPLNHVKIDAAVNNLIFQLGLVELISYWKAACPREIVVAAGSLTSEQITWWQDLFLSGLGEFFYRNQIDFTTPDFLHISSTQTTANPLPILALTTSERDLILVGGGKDSAVTLSLLKTSGRDLATLILNPTRAAKDNVRLSGLGPPLVVERTLDPQLLHLNNLGYLNGHTPFSAYLAFLGMLVAQLNRFTSVVAANENSANECNLIFKGRKINHQYSKTYEFENKFRTYAQAFLTGASQYFSFLRPLNELQISRLFATLPQFFPSFRSCNVGSKTDSWCGRCAKCAFIYLSLSPFLTSQELQRIFNRNLFTDPQIGGYIKDLVGLTNTKPFECVGTREESILALGLTLKKYRQLGLPLPTLLTNLEKQLKLTPAKVDQLTPLILNAFSDKHFLPTSHRALLEAAVHQQLKL
ncbi:MAG: hypothetical protein UV61_C0006G0123 [Candidatus Gottesmanbacteria bacterium GW2011_GWB1_43_11]|uniref:UDP-N-acetyl-alpha-D-muramoyl-L-alanyl-L-glutamate epimerase n=1 Tax=Candidatus Gottesmanbacteria bacterium GW2011_GWB1_43_11 TaxID=1618446 RepID=A0A0G1CN53_9BACT|nr:MAG: hypothetical protein UV17_C0008G0045 [Candidatus Gottesmanbacteria bacterium GW2011_GWA1_42_26]KKS81149.1 MAG: hypothetical protein UV55_C0019G0005 [Candidatus Gottesmanbacteria bacterium GW2011_GWC1_43_10]KKS86922.1 MAG: hypothetical protein UV61_C0006G0123 [Candidatus Gottesmanbacteria bacterium GW2011_GWB1_43_11]OGG08267.1 MAG: hypothetical protein A2699_06735 [Candidatus Gottesmanbacteria bacterium RIFCSPHIGHO2_01_FULL_43_15]HCM37956.1 hypothetical protein [Patescibacteria group bac